MPRKNLIRSTAHPYHVTARSNNRETFYPSPEETWEIFSLNLAKISEKFHVKIHSFVLMPNHFHLLLSTPGEDLGVVMQKFMASVTRTMNMKTGRTGRVFGARYHWSLINTDGYFDYALKYVYRNPVRAGLVKNVEDYAMSSLAGILKKQNPLFQLFPLNETLSIIPEDNVKYFLDWLNQPFKKELEESIQRGLKKKNFLPTNNNWKRGSAINLKAEL